MILIPTGQPHPLHARALAFDGTNFWTNHREQNQIVCFARPE
jgi:hypothetical protein